MIAEQLQPLARPIDEFSPHPANSRDGDVGAISESLRRFAQQKPIVVQKSTGYICAGNHLWKAAKALGWSEIAANVVDTSDEEALAFLEADNRSADLGSYFLERQAENLQALADGAGLEGTGWDTDDLDRLLADLALRNVERGDPVEKINQADELQKKWATELGQVWVAGKHRIVCGDATDAAVHRLALAGRLADLVVTDPPYNVDYVGGNHGVMSPQKRRDAGGLTIENDVMSDVDFAMFLTTALAAVCASASKGAPVYVFAPAGPTFELFQRAYRESGLSLRQGLVWHKQSMVMGRSDYHYQHEPILYGWKPGAAHRWYGGRDKVSVLDYDRPSSSQQHPTMKPVPLVAKLIENSSEAQHLVFDPFLGSGTTLVAAEQEHRAGCGIELDPCYVAVTLERLADMGVEPRLETSAE